METATIRWKDGTELEVRVNCATYIMDEEPDFPDDLTGAEVITEEGTTRFVDPKIIECASGFEPGYWFTIVEKTSTEKQNEKLARQQADIANVEDAVCEESMANEDRFAEIEDAICELSEALM